jgi:hypothetical protein
MRPIHGVLLGGVLILASTGVALGQRADADASGAASSTTRSTTTQSTGAVDVSGQSGMQAQMKAATSADAGANVDATLRPIRQRAMNAPAKSRAAVDKKLSEISAQISGEANEKGDAVVAGRIGPEFGMTAEALTAEQGKFDAGWGELVIAHTLAANAKTGVTAEQLFSLHREGLGWGQIAYGLNLRLGEVAAAVASEGSVAAGRAKADGKPAMIHSGTRVAANTNAGVHAGGTKVGAASSVGVGVKVGK